MKRCSLEPVPTTLYTSIQEISLSTNHDITSCKLPRMFLYIRYSLTFRQFRKRKADLINQNQQNLHSTNIKLEEKAQRFTYTSYSSCNCGIGALHQINSWWTKKYITVDNNQKIFIVNTVKHWGNLGGNQNSLQLLKMLFSNSKDKIKVTYSGQCRR